MPGSLAALELLTGTRELDAEQLMDAARDTTGLSRAVLDDIAGSLSRLVDALRHEADLSALGQWTARWDVQHLLSNLLRLRAEEDRAPASMDEAIVAPVLITGLSRSGTTFLHRLMAGGPGNLVPRHWQTVYPCPVRFGSLDISSYHQ
ncbi:MAG: hypothetical protein ACP5VR_13640 [Acidimicrobiales bacterium]